MRLIVLEGPDGAGKTTLAKELEKCGCAYVHHGVPTDEESKDLFRWRLNALIQAQEFQQVVFDRLHLSERIYGPVMRGSSLSTELHEKLIERYLYARGGQVVVCLPPWRVVLANWLKNQENEYVRTPAALRKIYDEYEELVQKKLGYWRFDYTISNMTAYAKSLSEASNFELPKTWVGSPSARFLFVGERANGLPDLPFMDSRNSSGYLHECLNDAGYEEEEIAFTNAYQYTGEINPYLYMSQTFVSCHVIALGSVAHRVLKDIPHALVEHPAYFKRFHTLKRAEYVAKFASIRRSAK